MTIIILNIAISSTGQVNGIFKDPRDGKIYKTVLIDKRFCTSKTIRRIALWGNFVDPPGLEPGLFRTKI